MARKNRNTTTLQDGSIATILQRVKFYDDNGDLTVGKILRFFKGTIVVQVVDTNERVEVRRIRIVGLA